MTLVEYAHKWYDMYQATKPYMEFRTFVESLKRPSNSPLIESITNGVTVIIEANLGMKLGTIKNDSSEFKQLVDAGDKRSVLGYALPILYRLVQAQGGEDANKTDRLLTHAVEYVTDNWEKLLDYDGSTKPSTFLNNFVMWPVKQTRRREAGRTVEVLNYPHEECFATFEDDYNGMQTRVYGVVKNTNVPGGKVQITWKAGPKEGTVTTESKNDLVFYDLVEDSNRTVSASTPLDSSSDGQKETLGDTAAFSDTAPEKEARSTEAGNIIKNAVTKTATVMAGEIEPDDDTKYQSLIKTFSKYLNAMLTSSDNADNTSSESSGGGDIGFDVNEKRKEIVMKQTRKIQSFWIVIQKVINKLESTGKLQEIDPELIDKAGGAPAGDYVKSELNKLTAAPTNPSKKPANSENIKAIIGDTLYSLIAKVKQADFDAVDEYYNELEKLKANKSSIGRKNILADKYGINPDVATKLYNKFKSVAADDPAMKHYGSKEKILAASEND